MKKIEIMEWNINGKAGYDNYSMPNQVIDEVLYLDKDIVVLTEFVKGENWSALSRKLASKYWRYTTANKNEKQNEILIAIKKDIEGFDYDFIETNINNDIQINSKNEEKPNFLEIKIKCNKDFFTIIGTRIRVETNKRATQDERKLFKRKQFVALDEYLSNIKEERVVCIGDFNANWSSIWKTKFNNTLQTTSKEYEFYTPSRSKEKNQFSYVFSNGEMESLDHIIAKGLTVSNISYNWDFFEKKIMSANVEVKDFKGNCTKNGARYPDHAILLADILIE